MAGPREHAIEFALLQGQGHCFRVNPVGVEAYSEEASLVAR